MRTPLLSRSVEIAHTERFVGSASSDPAGLIFEGDAGVGKTSLWLNGIELARERGYTVLAARAAESESVMAYASIADLLEDVDPDGMAGLPEPQRLALDRALVRATAGEGPTANRTVAAGFLSVVKTLAAQRPVLIAIDDLQWLDPSSAAVIAFAARRLTGPVGLMVTVRDEQRDAAARLQLPTPESLVRVKVSPFAMADLATVIAGKLERPLSRSTLSRIFEISGGNPFYAIELARSITAETTHRTVPLPQSLADVVRARVHGVGDVARSALLATACLATPTVDLVAHASDVDVEDLLAVIEDVERRGIVAVQGNRIQFVHPLLAHGVYADASPAERRATHRRLAERIDEPEVRARHLALSAIRKDPHTLEALDVAAGSAQARGAPAAAAEFLDFGIALGDDAPERHIRSASCHFDAGDAARARLLLERQVDRLGPGVIRAQALGLLALVRIFGDSFSEATALLERAVGEADGNLPLMLQMLIMLTFSLVNTDRTVEATTRAEEAVTRATEFGDRQLLGQALSMRSMVGFMSGKGLDSVSMQRALDMADRDAEVPVSLRPSAHNALLMAWTGELESARTQIRAIRRQCADRGEESELTFIAFTTVLTEIWRGDYAEAAIIADETVELARRVEADVPRFMGSMLRAAVAAYTGDVDRARRDATDALETSKRVGSIRLAEQPVMTAGFVEHSLGNHEAAVEILSPLIARLLAVPDDSEIITAWFVPDAVEALVALGRVDEAEALTDLVQRNGHRLDRPWMLAVGARCRSLALAARGDLTSAMEAAREALQHHDRLPMPFERARTELVMGQLQRRRRRRDAAAVSLQSALAEFERLGTPIWADRARAELERARFGAKRVAILTPSERRVAELVATGMTNRDVASALFISAKTVEANLARVYRKLGIHSRAELGRYVEHEKG